MKRATEPGVGELLLIVAAPQGFEPRYADPESAVLPLNEGAAVRLEPNDAAIPILLGVMGAGQLRRAFRNQGGKR
jgi:hypothetical protein